MGRRVFNVGVDRKTSSVCGCHDLGAFATLCLADIKPLFFRCEATAYERLSDIELTACIQVFDLLLCNAPEYTLPDPLLEPPMARLV
jgi:hypothetical protein